MRIKQINIKLQNKNTFRIIPQQINDLTEQLFTEILKNKNSVIHYMKLNNYTDLTIAHATTIANVDYLYKIHTLNNTNHIGLRVDKSDFFPVIELDINEDFSHFKEDISIIFENVDNKIEELNIVDFISLASMTYPKDADVIYFDNIPATNNQDGYQLRIFKLPRKITNKQTDNCISITIAEGNIN